MATDLAGISRKRMGHLLHRLTDGLVSGYPRDQRPLAQNDLGENSWLTDTRASS
jgi:hypothetical protein